MTFEDESAMTARHDITTERTCTVINSRIFPRVFWNFTNDSQHATGDSGPSNGGDWWMSLEEKNFRFETKRVLSFLQKCISWDSRRRTFRRRRPKNWRRNLSSECFARDITDKQDFLFRIWFSVLKIAIILLFAEVETFQNPVSGVSRTSA